MLDEIPGRDIVAPVDLPGRGPGEEVHLDGDVLLERHIDHHQQREERRRDQKDKHEARDKIGGAFADFHISRPPLRACAG